MTTYPMKPKETLDAETAQEFYSKYRAHLKDGTFEKDRALLNEYKQIAKEAGIEYGSKLMPKFQSKRLTQALETARSGIAEQGIRPVMEKGEIAQNYDVSKDPTQPAYVRELGTKAANLAENFTGGLGAPFLMPYSNVTNDPAMAQYTARNLESFLGTLGGSYTRSLGPAATGALVSSRVPHPLGKLLTFLGVSGLASLAQPSVEQFMMGKKNYKAYEESTGRGTEKHPLAAIAGNVAGSVTGAGQVIAPIQGAKNIYNAGRAVPKLATRAGRAALTPGAKEALTNVALAGGLPAGISAAQRIGRGERPRATEVLGNAVLGPLMGGAPVMRGVPVTPFYKWLMGRGSLPGGPTDIYGGGGPTPTPRPESLPGVAPMGPSPAPGTFTGGTFPGEVSGTVRPTSPPQPYERGSESLAQRPAQPRAAGGIERVSPSMVPGVPTQAVTTPQGTAYPAGVPPVPGGIERGFAGIAPTPPTHPATPDQGLLALPPPPPGVGTGGVPPTVPPTTGLPDYLLPGTYTNPHVTPAPELGIHGPDILAPPGPPIYGPETPSPYAPSPLKRGPKKTTPAPSTEPAVPKRGDQVETPGGRTGTYKAKGTDNGKPDGKPVIWVMHPGDAKSTMYPVDQVDVVGGKFTQENQRNAVLLEQAGIDPSGPGPKTPKTAQDVIDLFKDVKESDLNPTQKQHLSDARKILAQEKILNAAEQKLQQGGSKPKRKGGNGGGETPEAGGGNRPVRPSPVVPQQPGGGTTPVPTTQGAAPAANAATGVTPTPPEKPKGSVKAKTVVTAPAEKGKVKPTASAEAGRVQETAIKPDPVPGQTYVNSSTGERVKIVETGTNNDGSGYVLTSVVGKSGQGNSKQSLKVFKDTHDLAVRGKTTAAEPAPSPINGNPPVESTAVKAPPKRGDTYQGNNKKGAYGSWHVTAVRQGYVHMENSAGAYKTKVPLADFHNNYTQTDRTGRPIPINGNPSATEKLPVPPEAEQSAYRKAKGFLGSVTERDQATQADKINALKKLVSDYEAKYYGPSEKTPTSIRGNPALSSTAGQPPVPTPPVRTTEPVVGKSYTTDLGDRVKVDSIKTGRGFRNVVVVRRYDENGKLGSELISVPTKQFTDQYLQDLPVQRTRTTSTAGQPSVPTPPAPPVKTTKPPAIPAGVKPERVDAATADVKAAVQKWAADPMDSKARTDLTRTLVGHGMSLDDAAKFSSKLQGWVRGQKASGEGINMSLFGAESIPKLIGRAVAARRLRTAYEQTPTTDPRMVDLNTPKWDAGRWVNLPISITSPTGAVHQEGMLERNLGPKGAQASKILKDTSQTIDNEKLTAKRALDEIQAWVEAGRKKLGATVGKDIAGAVGKALTGVESAKDRFNRSFREYIEMTPAERATQDATGKVPPQVQKAVQLYDDFTGKMKQQLYDYQVNVLKREGMPEFDKWGITDQGYFHHAMFKNFHATMSNGAEVEAGTYGELLHEIEQHIKVHGTTLDKVSGYENRVNDPSVRIDQAKFWAMVEDVSKAGGLDDKGRRILSREDVMKDVLPGAIGTKANKSEFIGAILKRAGKEGYEDKAWRYIMNRYADNAIEGINVTKMRKQLQPLAEEIGKTNKSAQIYLENKMNLIAGKPTDNEIEIANAIHNWEIHTKTPGYSPNPLRSFRNLANQIQATTFYATLGTKPEFAVVNELQRYVTLMSRIGPVAMAKAEAAAVTPKNVNMLRELGILDGEYRIVNRGGTLQAVLMGKNKARLLNPVNAIRNASERNRAVGFMHGYNSIMDAIDKGLTKPGGGKFTREDAISEGHNYATMTEFKNNNFYSPDILKTPTGGLQWQYQGYTINNLKQWKDAVVRTYSPSLRHKGGITAKEARLQLGRKVVAQVAVGGVKSLMPAALMGAGTYFWLKDQGVPEPIARAVTFGMPSIGGIDISGQTAMAPDMIGNAAPGTTLLGPTVSSALRVTQEAKRDIEGGTFPERTMRTLPPTRQMQAAYSILTGQPLYYSIRGMKDGELTSLKDKLIVLTGGLPFEMTLSRAEAEEKRTRRNPGPSLPNIKTRGPLIPPSQPTAPSPPR